MLSLSLIIFNKIKTRIITIESKKLSAIKCINCNPWNSEFGS